MMTKITKRILVAVLVLVGTQVRAAFPELSGDGRSDDTAAIQSRLDAGLPCVYLPPPKAHYVISRSLVIGSGQELRLDRTTRIRLAPKSDCPMVKNRNWEKGDVRIAITGGIWDYDNTNQTMNICAVYTDKEELLDKYLTPAQKAYQKAHWPIKRVFIRDRYRGNAFYFENVRELKASGMTIRNPCTYGFQMCKVSYFTVEDIALDYQTWNPQPVNMDGIHLDGGCHHGRIANIRGTAYDDMVALNANDGFCAAVEDDITDVDIDGIYADYCHSGVRLLSTGAKIKRINIRNIHGNFYRYAVGFTHFFPNRKAAGVMDEISVSDCHVGKCEQPKCLWPLGEMPLFFFDAPMEIGQVRFSNVTREERFAPHVATFSISRGCRIERLVIEDCRSVNVTNGEIRDFANEGEVKELIQIGICSARGKVTCDLSSVRIREPQPLVPVRNAGYKVKYPERVKNLPRMRGVMLGTMKGDSWDNLQSWGANLVRYQFAIRGTGPVTNFEAYAEGFRKNTAKELDNISATLDAAKAHGMKVVLDAHYACGGTCSKDAGDPLAWNGDWRIFHDKRFAKLFAWSWQRIAERCKGRTDVVYGYDLMNEAHHVSPAIEGCDLVGLQEKIALAIRAIDPDTPIIVESMYCDPGWFRALSAIGLDNVIYQVHLYYPHDYTHQGILTPTSDTYCWPDPKKGWNKDFLLKSLKPVIDFQKEHDAKIFVGEFSAISWAANAEGYVRDCIEIFEELGWDWTYHAYREFPGWSVEHEAISRDKSAGNFRPSADNPRKRVLLAGLRGEIALDGWHGENRKKDEEVRDGR